MENFTEGEWEYEQYAFGDKRVLSKGTVVAIIACTDVGDEQCEANAALIAAAPEMYAELIDAKTGFEFIIENSLVNAIYLPAIHQQIESINSILAKARGEK